MAAHRYWRLTGFCVDGTGPLELSEARLYAAKVLVDASATITCPFVPLSGTLTELKDGLATGVVSWPFAAHHSSGFSLVWDMGAAGAADVDALRLGSGNSASTFPSNLTLQYSDDGGVWAHAADTVNVAYPGPLTLTQDPVDGLTAATSWSPDDKGANCVLSNNNLTMVGAINGGGRSVHGVSEGKWYWEVSSTGDLMPIVGVARSTAVFDAYPGFDANGWSYFAAPPYARKIHNSIQSDYGTTWDVAWHVVGVALDMDNGTLEFYKNGVSMGVAYSGLAGLVYAMNGGYTSYGSSNGTTNFGGTPFAHPVPTGFTAGLLAGAILPVQVPTPRRWSPSPQPIGFSGVQRAVGSATGQPLTSAFFDAYHGGNGRLYGTVKEKHAPLDIPLRREVLLIDKASRLTIRVTWSDHITGDYEFIGIRMGVKYTVLAYDHFNIYRVVGADEQIPELML